MPCLSVYLVYVFTQVVAASHVFFADKSSDDRVCVPSVVLTVICRGSGF